MENLADLIPGRWWGVHTPRGHPVHNLLHVHDAGRGLRADGLAWFALAASQVRGAAKGQPPRLAKGLPGFAARESYDVSFDGERLTFRGLAGRYVHGGSGKYRPGTFAGRLEAPGLVAGDTPDAKGENSTFQLWREHVLDGPSPLDVETGRDLRLTCRHTDRYHYRCYVPASYDPAVPAPVLVNFSPGGDAPPLSTRMADELGWIMVGLTESQNGPIQPGCENRDAALFDLRRRCRVHPARLYFAGFSGGARLASWSALCYPDACAGAICIGASFAARGDPPLHQPVFFIVGRSDFNHEEVTRRHNAEATRGRKTELLIHPGGHSWGRAEDHERAIRWLAALS